MSSAFKLPNFRDRNASTIEGVRVFNCNALKIKDIIGKGSFGVVYSADYTFSREQAAETVVVKKVGESEVLDDESTKLFLKEVALLNELNHSNVVNLKAVCYKPCAFMMEYVYFSFSPFGDDTRVSSLGDFLLHADKQYDCEGFEQLIAFAGGEIVRGLAYLHSKGVAHRDLKPGNILVGNKHYCSASKDELAKQFNLRPVVCKLTDFGESRSRYLQTNSVHASRTGRLNRGTMVYMSPELLLRDVVPASIDDLICSDIWSLGMTLFTMINPNLQHPFLLEIRSAPGEIHTQEAFRKLVINLLRHEKRPLSDDKYTTHRASVWFSLEEVYMGCTNFDPDKRISLSEIKDILKPFNVESEWSKEVLLDHLKGVIYGNCVGDAIGLLTEFMTKEEAKRIYVDKKHPGSRSSKKEKVTTWMKAGVGCPRPDLEYSMKYSDGHRYRWETGDWTDDSDQMILILQTLLDNNGKMVALYFASKLIRWRKRGFEELGDNGGMGIGRTTSFVLGHPDFITNPHKAAEYVWETSGKTIAPNEGVMRTSILGTYDFGNIDKVIENTVIACKVTNADPRCIASCVAVTTAIAMMLQGKHWTKSDGYNVKNIIKDAFEYASSTLETEEQKEELKSYMDNESLEWLKLDEPGKIGYTYKCMGAGFWSLRQKNFRESLQAITFEAGDADTNGAVAGALLGCKLGADALPRTWLEGLKHKYWLDEHIKRYLKLLGLSE